MRNKFCSWIHDDTNFSKACDKYILRALIRERCLLKITIVPKSREVDWISLQWNDIFLCAFSTATQKIIVTGVCAMLSTQQKSTVYNINTKRINRVCLMCWICSRSTMTLPSNQWTIAVSLIAHWLCYFNSAVNPVIYNFMSGKGVH